MYLWKVLFLVSGLLLVFALIGCDLSEPIKLHPQNPHYFSFKGEPTILLGSTEHYGAVLNLDFEFFSYFDELSRDNLNLTRTFTGVYCEHPQAFNIAHNTLAPDSGRFICPWARSNEPGYYNGGHKFDLTQWDQAYFSRLKNFVREAARRNIIVELVLFCTYYGDEQWNLSPLNHANNINGIGKIHRREVLALKDSALTQIQEAMVRKIVTELNDFENLYYEICNEPYFEGVTLEWQQHISEVIAETEKSLPKTHLIAQNIANNSARIENPNPLVSIFNFHYAASEAVDWNYHLNRVIGDDETGFAGTHDAPYRLEGWNLFLSGGGLYNHLDYSFTTTQETGTFAFPATQPGGGGRPLRKQFQILKNFMENLDFIHMQPDHEVLTGGIPDGMAGRILSDHGSVYAGYFYQKNRYAQNYSLRWTAILNPEFSETYTFYTITDDGVRLWVNQQQLIDDWTGHAPLENRGTIKLRAGEPVILKMEFYQGIGGAKAQLLWSSTSQAKTIIPGTHLTLPDGAGNGLMVEWFDDTELQHFQSQAVVSEVDFNGRLEEIFPHSEKMDALQPEFNLPGGVYTIEWLDTKTGEIVKSGKFEHQTGKIVLSPPEFKLDIALKVKS